MMHFLLFVILGLFVGAYGTLIGAGGGFLLVPILIWLYPSEPPELLASISLAVVFFNALSGSAAYGRMHRIEYKSGLFFSLAALPGSILGALSTSYIPRRLFDGVIGLILVVAALHLFLHPQRDGQHKAIAKPGSTKIHLIDSSGTDYTFSYNLRTGLLISFAVGYFSSILGIGGGIIHVPALVYFMNFPVYIATATSHFILALMAFSGSITHLVAGTLQKGIGDIVPLSIGVILGAQVGARLSHRFRGNWILAGLAIALLLVGLRTLWGLFV